MLRPLLALLAIAGAGCNQSLFDSNPGDAEDASQTEGDGGDAGDASGADAGDDAAPVAECPAPCSGDAFADFSEAQGGANGRWSYLVDTGAPNGAEYIALEFATWNGIDAWAASPGGPAIASCRDQTDPACDGLSDFVLLVPSPGVDGPRPTLAWRAPETATYRLSGAVRAADGAPEDVPVSLIVSRAGRPDALAVQSIRTSSEETALAALVPALEGDEIAVTIGSADAAPPPLGVRMFLTRVDQGNGVFPGTCQAAARFDADNPLVEGCRDAEIDDRNDNGTMPSTAVPGPSSRLGDGRALTEGQYLVIGNSPMVYTGDFTLQFWARLDEPQPTFDTLAFSDTDIDVGGLRIVVNDENIVSACYVPRTLGDFCVSGDHPTDGLWHFWRLVRSTADATFLLCIDGEEQGRLSAGSQLDMTGAFPPYLGRNPFQVAVFGGSFDEFRVFSEALPCATPLR